MTKTFEFVYSSSTSGVLIGTLVKTGVTREQILHPWGHRIQEGWQLCKYNFYMSLSQFFFPMNMERIWSYIWDLKEVSFTTYQMEEIEIIQKSKYGVRTWAESYPTKKCRCENAYHVWESLFNSICKYGTHAGIQIDTSGIAADHLI